jgi:alpha-D-ribose 1-methylphosphonate 5-triphosphate synthase subunit PhnL
VVLQGSSGSGKSTLLRCVHGGALADSGSILVRVDGRNVDVVTLRDGVVSAE